MYHLMFCAFLLLGLPEVTVLAPLPYQINPANIRHATFDGKDTIYFTSMTDQRIFVCDTSGKALPEIGRKSEGPDGFLFPMALRYQHPYLYVSDIGKRKIIKVDPVAGTLLQEWQIQAINNFQVADGRLILAYNLAQQGHVFGRAQLGDTVVYGDTFYESPGLERVQGTKTSGILPDGPHGVWVAYTGPYDLRLYAPDGRLVHRITDAPVDFVPPPRQAKPAEFSPGGRSEHFRSFDKIVELYACGDLIVLFRFKHMEEQRLDCYYRDGTPFRLGIPISNLVPVGSDGTVLYALQASSDAREDAADMNLVTLDPRSGKR